MQIYIHRCIQKLAAGVVQYSTCVYGSVCVGDGGGGDTRNRNVRNGAVDGGSHQLKALHSHTPALSVPSCLILADKSHEGLNAGRVLQ